MKPEYEAIAKKWQSALGGVSYHVASAVAECEALAVMPLRKLTDAEVDECWRVYVSYPHYKQQILGVIAKADEIRARPSEPETIPFDYEKWNDGGWQAYQVSPDGDGLVDVHTIMPRITHVMRRKP